MRTSFWWAITAPAFLLAARSCDPGTNPPQTGALPADASRMAWTLFVQANVPAADAHSSMWETWAAPRDLFASPELGTTAPQWPGGVRHQLEPLQQQLILLEQLLRDDALLKSGKLRPFGPEPGRTSEVRYNCAAFAYVVNNDLWHENGIMKRAADIEAGKAGPVDFGTDALVVKAGWRKRDQENVSQYHVFDDGKTTWLLVALHIASRLQPNWFWATWEHKDNPPQPPMDDAFGFPGGAISSDLQTMFTNAHLLPEWTNYRLNGAQTDFNSPTIRANSVLEKGFTDTSSCMTCHARAAMNAGGSHLEAFAPGHTGYTGPPQSSWYEPGLGGIPHYAKMGFLWTMITRAKILYPVPQHMSYTCPAGQ
jgi:hypothetical protein